MLPDDIMDRIAGIDLSPVLRAALAARLADLDQEGFTEAELLSPAFPGTVSLIERRAIAFHAAALLDDPVLALRYRAMLDESIHDGGTLLAEIDIETRRAAAAFPAQVGPSPASCAIIGDHLAEAFRFVRATLAGHHRAARPPRNWDRAAADILSRLLTMVVFQARLQAELTQFSASGGPLHAE